jgi:RimJ/RimL family protein N-acetyltransferase
MEFRARECTVRTYRMADAADLARHGTDRRVWLGLRDRFPHPFTQADGEEYIGRMLEQATPTAFAIVVDDEPVGGISLHVGTDIERITAELGYWIGTDYWGRGITTVAVKLVTRYAFDGLGLERVFAVPFVHNLASARVLEKAGYTREAVMRKSALKDGKVLDQYLYAIVRE